MTTLKTLLEELDARGRLPAGAVERIGAHLAEREDDAPWYVVALTGLGAWVATIFFLVAIGLFLDWGEGWPQWLFVAVLLSGIGVGLRRASDHLFVGQLSLGLCLAGWGAACVAGGDLSDGLGGAAAAGLVACVALHLLHPDASLRFVVSLATATLLTAWWALHFENARMLAHNLPVIAWSVGAGLLFLRPGVSRTWMPLAHALAVAALAAVPLLSIDWRARGLGVPWGPSVGVLTLGLVALVVLLLRPVDERARKELLPAGLVAVLLLGAACWLGGPGLLVALGLLLLGHATARRSVEVLALVALPVFLFLYYRDLQVSLMAKSLSLLGTGAVLLGLRRALSSRPWAKEAA